MSDENKIYKYEWELTDDDRNHLAIVKKLDDLDRMKPWVVLGFVVFWILWLAYAAFSIHHYLGWF